MAYRSDEKSPIFSEAQWADLTEAMSLSPRQVDVVKCVFRGFADKQTARHLGLKINTVRDYMGRIYLKVGVEDRVELVLCVLSRFLARCRDNRCPRLQGHCS